MLDTYQTVVEKHLGAAALLLPPASPTTQLVVVVSGGKPAGDVFMVFRSEDFHPVVSATLSFQPLTHQTGPVDRCGVGGMHAFSVI